MNRETSSLISIETIKAIIKNELGVNLYYNESRNTDIESYYSKNLNYSVLDMKFYKDKRWFVNLSKETKSGIDLEIKSHNVKTEEDLLDLIRKFKKVRKMI